MRKGFDVFFILMKIDLDPIQSIVNIHFFILNVHSFMNKDILGI